MDVGSRSYTCAFCESNYVVEFDPLQSKRQRPEFVIGFAVAIQQAQERFRQWLTSNAWFHPGDLNSAQVVDKLRGVYLPFWSFSMLAESNWTADVGEHWYRTETYTTTENGKTVTRTRTVTETEWWSLSGRHHNYYSGYLVSGSRGLKQREADAIQPFHLAALKRYEPYFLAGWASEEYSVGRDDALKVSQDVFFEREQRNVEADLPGDTHNNVRVETTFDQVNSDLILLPVYMLTYRYHGKQYRFLMNGQTGRVSGQKPISGWRIAAALGVALALAAVAVLTWKWWFHV